MCGICGFVGFRDRDLLERMTHVQTHRGPDDWGVYLDGEVGLGVRRLSIIDLSGGHQPMANEDGTVWIAYNGEIYNHAEIAADLRDRGHTFRTQSDTEMVVHAYEEWGLEFVEHFNGMFALAIHDRPRGYLLLARDRLGIKPLYYWTDGSRLLFASEIKAILAAPFVPRRPDLSAVDAYLGLRFVPGPGTIFEGISRLSAGHLLLHENGHVRTHAFWRPVPTTGPQVPEAEVVDRYAETLEAAVRRRLMSDVPFGAYLSGGLDSSVVVAVMARLLDRPVRTFSIGFGTPGDELGEADAIARILRCEHHPIVCRPEDIRLLPEIIWHLDEPVGDAIVLPMYLLAREAHKHVKMVLTGEGGDETLAGYLFHKVLLWTERYRRTIPAPVRRLVHPILASLPAGLFEAVFSYPARLGDQGRAKFLRVLAELDTPSLRSRFHRLLALFDPAEKVALCVPGTFPAARRTAGNADGDSSLPLLEQILRLQYLDWLPDDILTKQDKMSMAHSVEARVPFLDHTLVEFLAQIPPRLKLAGWTDKVLLRRYAARLLPPEVARRKKKAFYMPVEAFWREPAFTELLQATLGEAVTRRRGLFQPQAVDAIRRQAEGGEFIALKQVVALMMLELWFQTFIDGKSNMG